jgi:hypothetical protein
LYPGQIVKIMEGIFGSAIPVFGGFPNNHVIFI